MLFLKDILHLFYPNLCVSCSTLLLKSERILCTFCQHDLPIINTNRFDNNEIINAFYGRINIKKATSFLYFNKKNSTQKLIHQLKYKGNQEIGTFIGNWFGSELKKRHFFNDIDYIIPVPLHPKKEKTRGYNQLTTFGKSLSNIANIAYKDELLLRISSTRTQTLKERFERFSNSNTVFHLTNTSALKNKHILLIDDVITTGATIEACCNELLKTENITISIATISYTQQN